jgi:predicted DNA-binding transcriptional regulator AlpA
VADISENLKNFDDLPDSAHVRLPVVAAIYGCSQVTVWRRCKSGHIPKPKNLGGKITVWNVGDIRKNLSGKLK